MLSRIFGEYGHWLRQTAFLAIFRLSRLGKTANRSLWPKDDRYSFTMFWKHSEFHETFFGDSLLSALWSNSQETQVISPKLLHSSNIQYKETSMKIPKLLICQWVIMTRQCEVFHLVMLITVWQIEILHDKGALLNWIFHESNFALRFFNEKLSLYFVEGNRPVTVCVIKSLSDKI